MIVKRPQQLDRARTATSRDELRDVLIELWAQVFEAELRAELQATADEQRADAAPSVADHGRR